MMKLERLKSLREKNKINQKEIAKILNTTQQQYSKYELGIQLIPVDRLIILADYYKVSVDYLLERTNNEKYNPIDKVQ